MLDASDNPNVGPSRSVLRDCHWRDGEEKAAGEARQHQHGKLTGASAGAWHWASDGAEDSANAQIVRAIQERR